MPDYKTDNGENARMHEMNKYAKRDARTHIKNSNTQANDKANNGESLADTWRIESGELQHSSTNKRSRPEILGPRRKRKREKWMK